MKSDKVCVDKRISYLAIGVVLVVGFVIYASLIGKTKTSSNTRASLTKAKAIEAVSPSPNQKEDVCEDAIVMCKNSRGVWASRKVSDPTLTREEFQSRECNGGDLDSNADCTFEGELPAADQHTGKDTGLIDNCAPGKCVKCAGNNWYSEGKYICLEYKPDPTPELKADELQSVEVGGSVFKGNFLNWMRQQYSGNLEPTTLVYKNTITFYDETDHVIPGMKPIIAEKSYPIYFSSEDNTRGEYNVSVKIKPREVNGDSGKTNVRCKVNMTISIPNSPVSIEYATYTTETPILNCLLGGSRLSKYNFKAPVIQRH